MSSNPSNSQRSEAEKGHSAQPLPLADDHAGAHGRCTRCLMPRATVGLTFDQQGVCNLCTAHTALQAEIGAVNVVPHGIEEKIEQLRVAGRGRPYDCIVGFSGGRDSAYLLHQLVRVHKVRCLAAYYRTPFTHDVIDANVHRVVSRLGVPLEPMDISQKQHADVARRVLQMWQARPSLELTNLLCAVCKYVNRELFRIARKHRVAAVINGGNQFESFQVGLGHAKSSHGKGEHGLIPQIGRSVRLARRGLGFLLRNPRVIPLLPLGVKSALFYISPHSPYLRARYPDIMRLDYYHHTPYNEEECTRVVRDELGWELPPDCVTYWRADCAMDDLKNAMFHNIVGATYRDSYFSNMVRTGAVTRAEGMRRLQQEGTPVLERIAIVGQVLNMQIDMAMVERARRACQITETT